MATREVPTGPTSRPGRVVRGCEVALMLVLTGSVAWMVDRDHRREIERAELKRKTDDAAAQLVRFERRAADDIQLAGSRAERAEQSANLARTTLASMHESLAAQGECIESHDRALTELSVRQDSRFAESAADLRTRIEALNARLDKEPEAPISVEQRFRAIQRQSDPSVFLVYCSFTYETKDMDNDWTEHSATTWGTAFAVSDDGHLATNKHLVQPWKFDAELRALEAIGEVRIHEDSAKMAAWRVGDVCVDAKKQAVFTNGWSTAAGTMFLAGTADDVFVTKNVELGGKGSDYTVHALDNHDLALLVIPSAKVSPLALASAEEEAHLGKLDSVMAIGFPRGSGGLESTVAESSASMGQIRKIEDTIHITAPIVAGNSGGPVFDEQGHVVGVATRIYSETLGICIKAGHVRELLDRTRLAQRLAIAASVTGIR